MELAVTLFETVVSVFPDEAVQKVRGMLVHVEHVTMQRSFVHIVRNHEELEVDISRAQKRNESDRLRGIQFGRHHPAGKTGDSTRQSHRWARTCTRPSCRRIVGTY